MAKNDFVRYAIFIFSNLFNEVLKVLDDFYDTFLKFD